MSQAASRKNRAPQRIPELHGLIAKVALAALLPFIVNTWALAQPATSSTNVPNAASVAPAIVTFPNPNVVLSPYNWRVPGDGTIWAPIGGPYLKFSVTGTTQIIANIDTTINSALPFATDYPSLKVVVDDNRAVFVQFTPGATTAILASGLTTATHAVLIYAIGGNQAAYSSWRGEVGQTHIRSLQFDAGSTLSAHPRIFKKNCLIYGDSFLMGYNGVSATESTDAYYTYVDPSITWAIQLGPAMQCEVGVVDVGGSGYLQPVVSDGQPDVLRYWDSYDSTHARSFSPSPDYTINSLGINDHRRLGWTAAEVQAAVQSWLTAVRSRLPATKIFLYAPVGGEAGDEDGTGGANATQVRNAVTAFGDSNTFLIDAGTQLVDADNWKYATSFTGPDGVHPAWESHAKLAKIAIEQMQKALNGGHTTTSTHVSPGAIE